MRMSHLKRSTGGAGTKTTISRILEDDNVGVKFQDVSSAGQREVRSRKWVGRWVVPVLASDEEIRGRPSKVTKGEESIAATQQPSIPGLISACEGIPLSVQLH